MAVSTVDLSLEGPSLSRIAAGFWRLAEWGISTPELINFIDACVDMGITTFDHADIYGDYTCEQLFGQAYGKKPALRKKTQLVTKCDIKLISEKQPKTKVKHYDTSAEHIIAAVEKSLQNLRTDYIDLLLLHRPDPLMDADEVAEAFTTLYQDGKVLFFGVSNFTNTQFSLLDSRLHDFDLVTNQIEFSVLNTAPLFDGTLDFLQMLRLAPMAWSPLGGGALFHSETQQSTRVRRVLEDIGQELNSSIDQVALAWILRHPASFVSVMGTSKVERLKSAAEAESIQLTRQQWFQILEASQGEPVP